MNRNVESHFSLVPHADIQRSRFDRSHDVKLSFNFSELIPFEVDEVLPGDTFQVETSKVIRLQTLLTPVMDNAYLDVYWFFVPNRLVWNHWKEFMGENTQSAWLPETSYSIPQLKTEYNDDVDDTGWLPGSIHDYLGLPVNVPGLSVSALPYRAYHLIWDTFFRDQNLQSPANIYYGDAATVQTRGVAGVPQRVNKYHDYFTSALPAPQKGATTLAPITGSIQSAIGNTIVPVNTYPNTHSVTQPLHWTRVTTSTSIGDSAYGTFTNVDGVNSSVNTLVSSNNGTIAPDNLYVPSNGIASSLGVNIIQLRNAFQIQKLLEADARGGTRYQELIKSHFSVTSPDARLQRPEYLGGNRIPITIHQITNQSQGESDFLGDLGAMSLTTDRHSDYVRSFTEHGYVLGLMCARTERSYSQGIERFWSRTNRFDFYWPELANISETAILNKEIYAQGTSADDEVFGYQEAWADYRYKPNHTVGEMRPGVTNSLASWHFGDYYTSLPTLSNSWIQQGKSEVDRTLAVTSSVADQVFCDIYIKNFATRPMPTYSIPGLADHH